MNNALTPFTESVVRLLVDATLQATLLLLVALAVSRLLKRRAAAVRHAVWVTALASLVVLPVLISMLSRWSVLTVWPAAAHETRLESDVAWIEPHQDNQARRDSPDHDGAHPVRNARAASGTPIAGPLARPHHRKLSAMGPPIKTAGKSNR